MIRRSFLEVMSLSMLWLGILAISATFAGCEGIIVKGRVSLKGNEPFTYLAIETATGQEYALVGELTEEIRAKYQGKEIEVAGTVVKADAGPGSPAQLQVQKILEIY
jgi:hypothetical protein